MKIGNQILNLQIFSRNYSEIYSEVLDSHYKTILVLNNNSMVKRNVMTQKQEISLNAFAIYNPLFSTTKAYFISGMKRVDF